MAARKYLTLDQKKEIVRKFSEARASGMSVKEACQLAGTSSFSIYVYIRQIKKDANSAPVREVKQVNKDSEKILKVENARLKEIVAELMLDIHALKEYIGRK